MSYSELKIIHDDDEEEFFRVHIEGLQKNEKICVARWDYAIHKSSFSDLAE